MLRMTQNNTNNNLKWFWKNKAEFFQGMVWGLRGSVWDFWNSGEVWEENSDEIGSFLMLK